MYYIVAISENPDKTSLVAASHQGIIVCKYTRTYIKTEVACMRGSRKFCQSVSCPIMTLWQHFFLFFLGGGGGGGG